MQEMNDQHPKKPFVLIAGPCMAESFELLETVAAPLVDVASRLGCDFYFKASFDKANRTSAESFRGPGLEQLMDWFSKIKAKHRCKVLTDVHECHQVAPVAQVCEGLQIPAFLCRQTDLLVEAAQQGQFVNIKKGQFVDPQVMIHSLNKGLKVLDEGGNHHTGLHFGLTERGTFFGYGDLVVDLRSLRHMYGKSNASVIFDATHSAQKPSACGGVSGGERGVIPLMARAAAATGYLDGLFVEVHPTPASAKSDAATQLSVEQAVPLIEQVHSIWENARTWQVLDEMY